MNRLSNTMGINSRLIMDSRLIANTISLLHNDKGDLNDEAVNSEVREFKQQQMAVSAMRNKNDLELFQNSSEFHIAYMEFKQKQMGVRAERNRHAVPHYKNLNMYINRAAGYGLPPRRLIDLQEDDMTAM